MFYSTDKNQHGLPHDPFKALVSPRPIGWISTLSKDGIANIAPYSFFQAVSDNPKIVMFSSAGIKDSATNAIETGEFVCNIVGAEHMKAMNASSENFAAGIDEFGETGLDKAPCELVKAPRVLNAAASLECKLTQKMRPLDVDGRETENVMLFGQVVAIHINDEFIVDGRFDVAKAGLISRLGYLDYDRVEAPFELKRPV